MKRLAKIIKENLWTGDWLPWKQQLGRVCWKNAVRVKYLEQTIGLWDYILL